MTPVTDEERYRRVVEEDSKRKRDLAGYHRVLDRQQQIERDEWTRSPEVAAIASDLWPSVLRRLKASVPESTFRLWLEPVGVLGAADETLVLAGPLEILSWTERRYSHLILEALSATGSDFKQVRFVSGGEG